MSKRFKKLLCGTCDKKHSAKIIFYVKQYFTHLKRTERVGICRHCLFDTPIKSWVSIYGTPTEILTFLADWYTMWPEEGGEVNTLMRRFITGLELNLRE